MHKVDLIQNEDDDAAADDVDVIHMRLMLSRHLMKVWSQLHEILLSIWKNTIVNLNKYIFPI